jgi:hypothetical protein
MNARTACTHFDGSSLQRLAGLVGAKWRFVTGDTLPERRPGSLAAFDAVIAAVEGRAVAVCSRLGTLDFEGYEEEYPFLTIEDADPSALEQLRKSGRMFFQKSGMEVRRVHIVREEITALRDGEVEWIYRTDVGVVFELSGAAVGIVKSSHHVEALFVSIGDSVDALDLPDRTIEWDWDNELGEEYRTRRDLIPLELLSP